MSSFPPPRPCGTDCTEAHVKAHGQGQEDGARDVLQRLAAWANSDDTAVSLDTLLDWISEQGADADLLPPTAGGAP